jgi:hypothetical protein
MIQLVGGTARIQTGPKAPSAVFLTRSSADIFLSGWRYLAQSRFRFLVFPQNRPLIHPESPGHPPWCARGLRTREKRGWARSVSERTREPHFLVANPPPLSLLCRRRHHPSPIRRPVACTPPSLLPPAYIPPSVVPSAYILSSGNSSRRASSTHPVCVRPFAWADMNSDDEEEQMFAELFE